MYELVLIACLLGQPARCEEVHLPFLEPMEARSCMYKAQFRMVEWMRTHSGWAVKRWRCELPPA